MTISWERHKAFQFDYTLPHSRALGLPLQKLFGRLRIHLAGLTLPQIKQTFADDGYDGGYRVISPGMPVGLRGWLGNHCRYRSNADHTAMAALLPERIQGWQMKIALVRAGPTAGNFRGRAGIAQRYRRRCCSMSLRSRFGSRRCLGISLSGLGERERNN